MPEETPPPLPPLPPRLKAVLGIGTDLELRTTLQHIVDGAAELTGARYAGLGMTDPGQDGLVEIRKADLGRAERAGIPVIGVPILVSKKGRAEEAGTEEEFGRLYLAEKPASPAPSNTGSPPPSPPSSSSPCAARSPTPYAAPVSPASRSPSTRRRPCRTAATPYA
ncbi:hypothetical protein ADL01_18070 [Streptomyces sp. NRRL WC-3618]|nr:hypothetical protein ADL01_18070 [Streptomyces sp. NRRL WC-3618]